MGFEWDPARDAANIAKHGISFAQATAVFDDPFHLIERSPKPAQGETRWRVIGPIGPYVMSVIFTFRGDDRRMISARRASRDERERYRQSAAAAQWHSGSDLA